jgi:hypothetical protein
LIFELGIFFVILQYMRKIKLFISSFLFVGLFILSFGFFANTASAVANITVIKARIVSPNQLEVIVSGVPGQNIVTVDPSKFHIDVNTGGISPLTPTSASIIQAAFSNAARFRLTFAGTPFAATDTAYDASRGLYIDASGIIDTLSNTNVVISNGDSIEIEDSQSPTISDVSIAGSGTNPIYAKVGDIVTVTFNASEDIDPSASYTFYSSGSNPVFNDGALIEFVSGNTWKFSYITDSSDVEGLVGFEFEVVDLAGNASSTITTVSDTSTVTFDKTVPTISEVTPVMTPTTNTTPAYTFTTNEAGTIAYGGACSSITTSATSGVNTITFSALTGGAYTNCTIVVSDRAGNASNTLPVTAFTITVPTASSSTGSAGAAGGGFNPNISERPASFDGTLPKVSGVCTPYLTEMLRFGDRKESVRTLQTFLKAQNFFTYPEVTTFFGEFTLQAVIDFQRKYASDILAPIGLTTSTGFVGEMTLKKINELSCK